MAPNGKTNLCDFVATSEWPSTLQDYDRGESLGQGAFATVFEASTKSEPDVKVALKITNLNQYNKSTQDMIDTEASLLKNLNHPNIVKLLHSFKEDGSVVLVLELVGDMDLEDKIRSKLLNGYSLMSEKAIWYYFSQVARAVEYLHDREILHRDLKTSNVLVSGSVAKVADLGLSVQTRQTSNTKLGTPFYMAPERHRGETYGQPSDVWSLGCILYEMCCGVSPFFGERHNGFSLCRKVSNGEFPPVTENAYSQFLNQLLLMCLSGLPQHRPTASFVASYAEKLNQVFRKY